MTGASFHATPDGDWEWVDPREHHDGDDEPVECPGQLDIFGNEVE